MVRYHLNFDLNRKNDQGNAGGSRRTLLVPVTHMFMPSNAIPFGFVNENVPTIATVASPQFCNAGVVRYPDVGSVKGYPSRIAPGSKCSLK